jgi:hypothetical protein
MSRWVSGSTLGKNFVTKAWLTMATCRPPARSWSVNSRPWIIGMPKVLKYPGVTMLNPQPGRLEGSSTGFPAISNGMPKLAPRTGIPVDTVADITPGTLCTRSSS